MNQLAAVALPVATAVDPLADAEAVAVGVDDFVGAGVVVLVGEGVDVFVGAGVADFVGAGVALFVVGALVTCEEW